MSFCYRPLRDIYQQLRAGQLSVEALFEEAFSRHERTGQQLNAYKTWAPDFARQQVRAATAAFQAGADCGPLQGIPVSVKDHFGTPELPTFAGTARELPEKFRQQGPVVTRLRQQLAVIPGKTHAVELAFGGIGLNNHWGTPRNPWDATTFRVPGGSSSGAGVSLWEGSAFLALGTDTGGSVRIPASMTGTVGLKTSAGRWSLDGIVPLSTTLDTPGILARSVDDLIIGFAALDPTWGQLAALEDALPKLDSSDLHIGIADGPMWDHCEAGVVAVVKAALDELAAAGARLSSLPLPEAAEAQVMLRQGSVVSAECDAFVASELPEWRELLDPIVTLRIAEGGTIPARDYVQRQWRLRELARRANAKLQAVQVIAAPTLPLSPPRLDEVNTVAGYRPRNRAALSNTCVGNMLGLCGISIPAGLDQNAMPAGLMLLARHGQEETLLAVARAVERTLGTPVQRLGMPPLCNG